MKISFVFFSENWFTNQKLKFQSSKPEESIFLHVGKVGCLFPMVLVSILHLAEFGPNDFLELYNFTLDIVAPRGINSVLNSIEKHSAMCMLSGNSTSFAA